MNKYVDVVFKYFKTDSLLTTGANVSAITYYTKKTSYGISYFKGYAQFKIPLTPSEAKREIGDGEVEIRTSKKSVSHYIYMDKWKRGDGLSHTSGHFIEYPEVDEADSNTEFILERVETGWTMKDFVQWNLSFAYQHRDKIKDIVDLAKLIL